MSPTEAIRIYLAYLSDKRKLAEQHSFAFTNHWVSYADFDQLNELVTSFCDQVDATHARPVHADGDGGASSVRADSDGSLSESGVPKA